jgi:hypothetical protein
VRCIFIVDDKTEAIEMSLLEKIKSFFSSNGGSLIGKNIPEIPSCVQTTENPELRWCIAEQIGDGSFGKIYKVSRAANQK